MDEVLIDATRVVKEENNNELLTKGLLLQYRLQDLGSKQQQAMSHSHDTLPRVDFVPTRLASFIEKPAGGALLLKCMFLRNSLCVILHVGCAEFFGYVKTTPIEAAGVVVSNPVHTSLVNTEEILTIRVRNLDDAATCTSRTLHVFDCS